MMSLIFLLFNNIEHLIILLVWIALIVEDLDLVFRWDVAVSIIVFDKRNVIYYTFIVLLFYYSDLVLSISS